MDLLLVAIVILALCALVYFIGFVMGALRENNRLRRVAERDGIIVIGRRVFRTQPAILQKGKKDGTS